MDEDILGKTETRGKTLPSTTNTSTFVFKLVHKFHFPPDPINSGHNILFSISFPSDLTFTFNHSVRGNF